MKSPNGNIIVTVESLLDKKPFRRPGFMDACKAAAIKWDEATGLVEFTVSERDRLKLEYSIPVRRGLGDIIASIATPIARALGMDCIDPATKDLKPESKCAKRKEALNRLKI